MAGQLARLLSVGYTLHRSGWCGSGSIEREQPCDGGSSQRGCRGAVCAAPPRLQQLDQCQCIYPSACRHCRERKACPIVRPAPEERGFLAAQGLPASGEDEVAIPGGGLQYYQHRELWTAQHYDHEVELDSSRRWYWCSGCHAGPRGGRVWPDHGIEFGPGSEAVSIRAEADVLI